MLLLKDKCKITWYARIDLPLFWSFEMLKERINDNELFVKLFGHDERIIAYKKRMLSKVYDLFEKRFLGLVQRESICLISVPNRVELLGKHTDYQGGETFLLTGPKNFFAISALSKDETTELINADPKLGTTVMKLRKGKPEMLREGEGSNYTSTVAKRLYNNLLNGGLKPIQNVKSVFVGDIPFGGGTSGSSSKLITDFYIFASVNGLLEDNGFKALVLENGRKAGIKMNQEGVDDFSLALSMYLAHYENGLGFGDLKGDRGVGTFGGSEDHTAILLGQRGKLLLCRYCPTELLERIDMRGDVQVIVAYSAKVAEKTKDAMAKYNRLSQNASSSVTTLNEINGKNYSLLRDFYPRRSFGEGAKEAYEQLNKRDKRLAERAYQFFMERDIIEKAVESMKEGDIAGYGKLINESHELSKRYLGNIVQEVDFLQHSANRLGAYGATGFGAGFGGSCYAIVRKSESSDFIQQWEKEYLKKFPQYRKRAQFDKYSASSGCYWEATGD